MQNRSTLPGSTNLIAQAQCGDMLITLAHIFDSDKITLRGMQKEDDCWAIIFSREHDDAASGLRDFASAIESEYAGA